MVADELEDIVKKLKDMVEDVAIDWKRPLPGRIYMEVPREESLETARKIFADLGCRFVTATGSDVGDELEVLYHFFYDAVGLAVNMRVKAPKSEPTVPAITPEVPGAAWIEREIRDLLGLEFEGHPRPERLILADDWPEGVHPLRKEKEEK